MRWAWWCVVGWEFGVLRPARRTTGDAEIILRLGEGVGAVASYLATGDAQFGVREDVGGDDVEEADQG